MAFFPVSVKAKKQVLASKNHIETENELKKNNGEITTSPITHKSNGSPKLDKTIVGKVLGGAERYIMPPNEIIPVPVVKKKVRKTVSNCLKEDADNKKYSKPAKEICTNCGNIFFVSDVYDREGHFISKPVLEALAKQLKTALELSKAIIERNDVL